ncbi:MAG: ABC transporter permease [Campylobacterales bacterium]
MNLKHIYRLGIKELIALRRDPIMIVLILFMFTFQVYIAGTAASNMLRNTPIAIVDEDRSVLSGRIVDSFYPPEFLPPEIVSMDEIDPGLDSGRYTFTLHIPAHFQRDVLAGLSPVVQLNVDATRMSQAFSGSGQIQQMVLGEVNAFVQRHRKVVELPVELTLRAKFNPTLEREWFGPIMEIISGVTTLSIVLVGAALIREREHGTIEHLLVMPVSPLEIMISKVWSMGLVVLIASLFSLQVVVEQVLSVPVQGSLALFILTVSLHLFASTSMGIFMATLTRSMPQFAMLFLLTLLPMQILSGGMTPRESMPDLAQQVMLLAPTTHFTAASQAILYRGAGLEVIAPHLLALVVIGAALFLFSLGRFRKMLTAAG